MKTFIVYSRVAAGFKKSLYVLFSLALLSCKSDKKVSNEINLFEEEDHVVQIVTENMDFQMKDTIKSGWNTFRYKNLSPQTHFFLIEKYPEGKTSNDTKNLIAPVFESAMTLIMEGKNEEGFAEFAKLPEWFSEVQFLGGSGLLSPNQTGVTTFYLEPGNYIVECYVKMSNGVFHTSMGMTKDLVVSNEVSGIEEPISKIDISISSDEGIVLKDSLSPGKQIFSVFYKDQTLHEHFVGHDVNLVKLGEEADLQELENWMNWADPQGLIEPAPNAVIFMGGVNDMPADSTGYFTATLDPGNYAFIAEVPNASGKNMLKTFVIPK